MTQSGSRDAPPQRILVIDDDPQTADLVRTYYRDGAFEILDAPDGESGLRAAAEQFPDVILLDLKMPGLNGIEVARRLQENSATSDIPVLLLTACRDTESKIEAFAAGANDFITKPFVVEEIDARIGAALRHRAAVVTLRSSNHQLETLLKLDEKTGLFNFREFQRRLRDEWQRAVRYATPLSLIFLDLDNFKQINDTLGHPAGDRALKEFATLVTGGARTNDFAARYGGEEFAVILPHTDGEMGARVARRIVAAVREFVFLEDEKRTHVTVSAGVATYPSSPEIASMDALVRAADEALYRAKDAGKDCVALFGETSVSRG